MFSVIEGRVLGCLMEKERTVPDQYPLTMNALVLACNQSSSREPIMTLDEHEVDAAITSIKHEGFLRVVHPLHGRSVIRYRQVLDEKLALEAPDAAILAVLFVRGPQTAAELRSRAERLHSFDSVAAVDVVLHDLSQRSLVRLLQHQHGQKEQRWQQILADEAESTVAARSGSGTTLSGASVSGSVADRVAQLEERVARLEAALADLM